MQRVAIPVTDSKLSEYFGNCNYYQIYDIDKGKITHAWREIPNVKSIEHVPAWVSNIGITDIVAFKLDERIVTLFSRYKVNVFLGIDIDTPEILIMAYINEQLTSNQGVINEILKI